MSSARTVVALGDSTKSGRVAFSKFAELSAADFLVTNAPHANALLGRAHLPGITTPRQMPRQGRCVTRNQPRFINMIRQVR